MDKTKLNMLIMLGIILLIAANLNSETYDSLTTQVEAPAHIILSTDATHVSGLRFQSNTSLILSFMQGFGLGVDISKSNMTHELFLMGCGGMGIYRGLDVSAALYIQNNVFMNSKPVGKFVKIEAGILANWDRLHELNTSKSESTTEIKYDPMFSVGFGRSYQMGKNSYFRWSLDAGVKSSPVNFNLSFVF